MAHVQVTIAGRSYRMACGDGEEPHLQELGRRVDRKIADLRLSFGEIGDGRITVMAALTFADELAEADRRLAALEAENRALVEAQAAARTQGDDWVAGAARAVLQAAERIEHLSRSVAVRDDAPSGAAEDPREGPA